MFISISLALLALSAGMFLLAKTNKDNLGLFYKTISLFVIIASFLVICMAIVCGLAKMMMHHEHSRDGKEQKEHRHHKHHHRFSGEWGNRGWNGHHGMGGGEEMRSHEEMRGHEEEWGEEAQMHHGFGRFGGRQQDFEGRHGENNSSPEERVERMTQRYTERLTLTADQQQKLKAILKASVDNEKELREKSKGDHDEFRKLALGNRQTRNEAIKKILTPEQLKQFNEWEEKRQEHERG